MKKYNIPEEDLRRMRDEEGMTQQEIADYFGVSQGTIRIRMIENGMLSLTEEERIEAKRQADKKYYKDHNEEVKEYQEIHKDEIKYYKKDYRETHKEEIEEYNEQYREEHKEEIKQLRQFHQEEINIYSTTGLQGARNKIRGRDWRNKQYQWIKRGLGRDIHIHHEWIPETDEYLFSALVDASEHLHAIIKPIIILQDNRIELLQDNDTHINKNSE